MNAQAPEALLARYEAWMRSTGWSPRTQHQRLSTARRIINRWPDPSLVTPLDVTEWLGSHATLSPNSRTTYYNDTRAYFRWLTAAEIIATDPMNSDLVVRPRPSPGVPKPLSADEQARALAFSTGDVHAYVVLALRAGLRASEIVAFRGEQVGEDFIIVNGKGSKEAAIPTHPEIWAVAQDYPRHGYWFPLPWDWREHRPVSAVRGGIHRLFRSKSVGISNGGIHRCRHTFATDLLRSGANIRQVQELMRHSNLQTTALYTAVTEDEMRNAVNRLGDPTTRGRHLRAVR